jgi:hypothetical protein
MNREALEYFYGIEYIYTDKRTISMYLLSTEILNAIKVSR